MSIIVTNFGGASAVAASCSEYPKTAWSMSMPTPEETKERATFIFNAAADTFDDSALGFWDHFGRKTVDHLSLPIGGRVLDVCCGSGASAIPAAQAIGPSGVVVGIDLADKLLELARAKAERRLLKNVFFHKADKLLKQIVPTGGHAD